MMDETIDCVCLQLSTKNELNCTPDGSMSKERKWSETGDWLGVEPLSTIRGSVDVVCSFYGIACFSSGLHLPEHKFLYQ